MVGTINSKSLLPKLSILMLTDLTKIPVDLSQETSLNGKYLKGIPTTSTDPNVNVGNADHTHTSDGDHTHEATIPTHGHSGNSDTFASTGFSTGSMVIGTPFDHTHPTTTNSIGLAEASNDGAHTHDSKTNELEHRTITFYKKTNTSIPMSRKSLPRNMTFFYSKTGVLPAGLLENLNYVDKYLKGDATPGTESGTNLHQHDSQIHNHPTDISSHEHTINFNATGSEGSLGSSGSTPISPGSHTHESGTAVTINKSSTPVTSGNDSGHQHDNINHEPAFKTLRLMEVNSIKMSNTGVPKNCIFLWLDLISLLVAGWQVSNGTNDTIDMLDKYPKVSETPDTIGGNDTHTHSENTATHSHAGASISHSHETTGESGNPIESSALIDSIGGANAPNSTHKHNPGMVSTQSAQSVTITDGASNHDHGAISNDPDSKIIAFIERV